MAEKKTTHNLTDSKVKNWPAPAKGRIEVGDVTSGLFLWVTAKGTKSWFIVYRLRDDDGARSVKKKRVLGRHDEISVETARAEARRFSALARQGIDPVQKDAEELEAEAQAKADRAAGSFKVIAEAYIAAMEGKKLVGGRKRPVLPSTATGRASLLRRLVIPAIGNRPLQDVTGQQVARLLSSIEAEDGPVDETLKVIRGVYRFAQSRGLFSGVMPTTGMTKRQPKSRESRVLSNEELRLAWAAADRCGFWFGSVIRMLMLTGQRRSEISELTWSEIDWDRRMLVLPAERVKNRMGTHEIPLSAPAMAILRDAEQKRKELQLKTPYVFPSDIPANPISGWHQMMARLDKAVRSVKAGLSDAQWRAARAGGALRPETIAMKQEAKAIIEATPSTRWRLHDLRHSFVTRARAGDENADGEIVWAANLDTIQATVNHELTAGVTKVYDHSDLNRRYRGLKRQLLDWWAGRLMEIVGETVADNVVSIAQGRAGK